MCAPEPDPSTPGDPWSHTLCPPTLLAESLPKAMGMAVGLAGHSLLGWGYFSTFEHWETPMALALGSQMVWPPDTCAECRRAGRLGQVGHPPHAPCSSSGEAWQPLPCPHPIGGERSSGGLRPQVRGRQGWFLMRLQGRLAAHPPPHLCPHRASSCVFHCACVISDKGATPRMSGPLDSSTTSLLTNFTCKHPVST